MPDTVVKSPQIVVPHVVSWQARLAAAAAYAVIRALALTLRYRFENRSGQGRADPSLPAIFCTWHNRLALALIIYQKFIRPSPSQRRLAAMVSASKDGAFLAQILQWFSAQPVRGSSSRRGPQALLELTTWAERGFDLALTPDGPRGPRYVVQEGTLALAQLTGLPIVPVAYYAARKICLKSWDQFQIPIPFSRCEVKLGEPLFVPKEATEAERTALRLELENRLLKLNVD